MSRALDRRILDWLGECGACKHNILRALAERRGADEDALRAALARLTSARLVESFRQRGGLFYRRRAR